MNLNSTIIPKSDQLNADDLIAGPRTIKITAVEAGNAEQPVSIRYEADNGRPYKPSKGMRRVLVAMWGSDGAAYIGRRLQLFCDRTVTFGADTTGGIRISHASDIDRPVEIALTIKRGKRRPFIVEPLPPSNADIGEVKAREGSESLKQWWPTLTPADRAELKATLDGTWKQLAAESDAKNKAA